HHHAGLRLATVTLLVVIVFADFYRVEWQASGQLCIDGVYLLAAHDAARDVGLIGDDDQKKSLVFQRIERRPSARRDGEFAKRTRWIRLTVANDCVIKNSVTIEKDCRLDRSRHGRAPSHFVWRILRSGWVTSRCQITA